MSRTFRARVGRAARTSFLPRFLELQIPMVLGAALCLGMGLFVRASGSVADVYRPGTHLFAVGDAIFLSVPVVVWMAARGWGWRDGARMAVVMLAPVGAIALVGELTSIPYLGWLLVGMYPVMSLGMLLFLVARRGEPRFAT